MRHIGYRLTAALVLVAGVLATAKAEDSGAAISVGMTRGAVIRVAGRPNYERIERNGVRCLAYRTRVYNDVNRGKLLLPRDGLVVALRHGRVIGSGAPLYSDISARCSDLASDYDRRPESHVTCYRKFWLSCP